MTPLSRRSFIRAGGAGLLAMPFVTARGAEAMSAIDGAPGAAPGGLAPWDGDGDAEGRILAPAPLRLDSNENPYGPASAVLGAVRDAFGETPRYPYAPTAALRDALAKAHGVKPPQVLLGCGSAEVLRMAVTAYVGAGRPLVSAVPTYEAPARDARRLGLPVRDVPVRADLSLDLDAMAREARGAGLVFLCNPNNPTGTVHDGDAIEGFITRVLRDSPTTTILVDEAYHEYVERTGYRSMMPLAATNPRVVVARTFSKLHGIAGLRVGYGVSAAETIEAMQAHRLPLAVGTLSAVAALAALAQPASHVEKQRALNMDAREFTARFFRDGGWDVTPSETNFVVADIRRDVKAFRDACQAQGVLVGRPFDGMPTRTRVSIGTLDEMRKATAVFRRVLQNV